VAALKSAVKMQDEAALCVAIFGEWRHHYRMGSGTGSPKSNSNNGTVAVSRHVLPSDLPTAIKHLDNQELNELFDAVVAERLRRGMKSPVPEKTPSQRTVDAAAVSLNLGKVNAVRAAFKAGVTPSKIAKEFGISQADVRKVIASEGLKR
jgi:type II secretory pathway component PulC